MRVNPVVEQVTETIRVRSRASRAAYLNRIRAAAGQDGVNRASLGCANLAHGFAACAADEKAALSGGAKANIAIVSAYNDMLSAHQPLETYPALIKRAVAERGGVAQFAGGVPAMCDGITQGRAGMELSLFSRDVIAQATAIALSHDMFDGAILLGTCDKIVPGLLIAALSFGHLPMILASAGPMRSGLPNPEKARVRQEYAAGRATWQELLAAEAASYHAPGTCTFYGTANTNQMLVEMMGVQLPGSSFVNPDTELRTALTIAAARRLLELTKQGNGFAPVGELVDERSIVNGVVGLLASGGSTNHTIHVVAISRAAGIDLRWSDFAALSPVVPLLARVYPNGALDVNHFHAAGGMPFLIQTLIEGGLVHADARTILGSLEDFAAEPYLDEQDALAWRAPPAVSRNPDCLRGLDQPFAPEGGLRMLTGNLGRAIIKTSAVKSPNWIVEAPAKVFASQEEFLAAFKLGELHRDFVAVVRFQGPRANGMPELHKLTPPLGMLQDMGFKVALVTDGRMSGASGKVPAAIHVTPEALAGGPLRHLRDGDIIRIDAVAGTLDALVDAPVLAAREPASADLDGNNHGTGRELFAAFRAVVSSADTGASVFFHDMPVYDRAVHDVAEFA